jgi:cell division protein ZipA
MDNLRWLLLVIGLVIIIAIYLGERFKRSRKRRRAVDRFFEEEYETGFSMAPDRAEEDSDYRDSLADLGQLLAQSRDAGDVPSTRRRAGGLRRQPESELDLPELRHDSEPEPVVPQPEPPPQELAPEPDLEAEPDTAAGEIAEEPAEPDRLIILYLKSPPSVDIHGTDLFRALHSVDMTLGEMGIYHDLDSRGRPVFSAANMFEPGTLEVADPTHFTTRGLALFMRLPGPVDEEAAFDRMLGKAELLADKLGMMLHDDQHQPLTEQIVERMRRTLKSTA